MKLKTLQKPENRRVWLVASKIVIALTLLFCAVGGAMAGGEPDPKPEPTMPDESIIPAISFGTILKEAYDLVAGWFKQIIALMVLAGGIYYLFGKSDKARADGLASLKRPVEALIAVVVILWVINWLYTL